MKATINESKVSKEDIFQFGNLIRTERGNLVLCTSPSTTGGRFGGLLLESISGLRVGGYYSGMRKEGATLFIGTVTISNEG